MKIFNQHNQEAISEIVKSRAVSYTEGEDEFSTENTHGVKLKASSTGDVSVQLAGNADDDWEVLTITTPNQYSDERIIKVRSTDTTIPEANLRVGY